MTQIGKEYGAALFMVAMEEGAEREYADALSLLIDSISGNPAYLELLSSPNIPMTERLAIIDQAFAAVLPPHLLSFLKLLCEKNRISGLFDAAEEYRQLLDASLSVCDALVRSAVPLSEDQKLRLKEKLERLSKKQVSMKFEIDEDLLGGVVIEMDGKVLDGSLRHRLNEVKDVISR